VKTIHITGQQANTAPAATESNARPTGNCQPKIAQADHESGKRRLPRRTPRPAEHHEHDTIGSTATMNEGNSELPMGVSSWWYITSPSLLFDSTRRLHLRGEAAGLDG
jgi:hypothetical protein